MCQAKHMACFQRSVSIPNVGRGGFERYARDLRECHVRGRNAVAHHGTDLDHDDSQRHSRATVFLHWSTLLLIALSGVAIFGRELVDDKAVQGMLMNLHRQAGLLVFLLLFLRLMVRVWPATPRVDHRLPFFLRLMAVASHGLIYLLLAGLPLMGWALSNARGVDVAFLGWMPLPGLVNTDPDLADTLADAHEWAAWGLYALVALHASAALWHHYVRRDQVLRALLPHRR
jgi:cytochrome b561